MLGRCKPYQYLLDHCNSINTHFYKDRSHYSFGDERQNKEEGGILFFWLSQFQLPASETKQNIAINLPHSLTKQFNSSSLAVERIMKSCTFISAQNSTKYILRLREKRQQKHLKPRYGKPLVLSTLGPCKSQRIEKDFI